MIFFMAMPFMIGLMNCILPLQIGARDVAFPFLNSLSFWLTAAGAMLVNLSLAVGNFSRTGWLGYPPLSELHYSPGVGRRLLDLGAADIGHRHDAHRHQLHRHHPQDARAGHDADAHAGVRLDRAVHEHPDRRRLPDPHRDAGDC